MGTFGVYQLLQLLVEEPLLQQPLLHQLLLQQLVSNLGLEITIVMMKTTMLHASLMVETAVIILPQTGTGIAQLANVSNKNLVKVLEALMFGSEITIAMMKTTMPHANLMVEIVVTILTNSGTGIAQNAHAFLANLDNVYGKKRLAKQNITNNENDNPLSILLNY